MAFANRMPNSDDSEARGIQLSQEARISLDCSARISIVIAVIASSENCVDSSPQKEL
jgi:hypothetical protein